MTVTITAVPNESLQAQGAKEPTGQGNGLPGQGSATEHELMAFVTNLQADPAFGMPQLANPSALAGSFGDYLRGYLDRQRNFERGLRKIRSADEGGGQVNGGSDATLTPIAYESPMGSHRGPARDPLESPNAPFDSGRIGTSPDSGPLDPQAALADVMRLHDMMVRSKKFLIESALLASGMRKLADSVNHLLKGGQ
jgi:hypothetical protein